MKILSPGAVFFHAEGRADMTKLIVAFRNFANVRDSGPKLRGHEEIEIIQKIFDKIRI